MRIFLVLLGVAGCDVEDIGRDDDDDFSYCSTGEGPSNFTVTSIGVEARDLTCIRYDDEWGCTGECCHAAPIGHSIWVDAPCSGTCVGLDETTCAGNAGCYVARDLTAFYAGAPDSFFACYPQSRYVSSSSVCALRSAAECASDGECVGLYDSAWMFVECVDEDLIAGSCTEPATCTTPAPTCEADRTPESRMAATGACIPNTSCG